LCATAEWFVEKEMPNMARKRLFVEVMGGHIFFTFSLFNSSTQRLICSSIHWLIGSMTHRLADSSTPLLFTLYHLLFTFFPKGVAELLVMMGKYLY
jgi:hypothetical protein